MRQVNRQLLAAKRRALAWHTVLAEIDPCQKGTVRCLALLSHTAPACGGAAPRTVGGEDQRRHTLLARAHAHQDVHDAGQEGAVGVVGVKPHGAALRAQQLLTGVGPRGREVDNGQVAALQRGPGGGRGASWG